MCIIAYPEVTSNSKNVTGTKTRFTSPITVICVPVLTLSFPTYHTSSQGTLLVTLRNSVSGQPIDDTEVRRKFQQFGDVKSVKHVGDRPE